MATLHSDLENWVALHDEKISEIKDMIRFIRIKIFIIC